MSRADLNFRVYNQDRQIVGALRWAEDAAALAGSMGAGTTIRIANKLVWHEGREKFSAAESYDGAAIIMLDRWRAGLS